MAAALTEWIGRLVKIIRIGKFDYGRHYHCRSDETYVVNNKVMYVAFQYPQDIVVVDIYMRYRPAVLALPNHHDVFFDKIFFSIPRIQYVILSFDPKVQYWPITHSKKQYFTRFFTWNTICITSCIYFLFKNKYAFVYTIEQMEDPISFILTLFF